MYIKRLFFGFAFNGVKYGPKTYIFMSSDYYIILFTTRGVKLVGIIYFHITYRVFALLQSSCLHSGFV